jgi:hypothetical protein
MTLTGPAGIRRAEFMPVWKESHACKADGSWYNKTRKNFRKENRIPGKEEKDGISSD